MIPGSLRILGKTYAVQTKEGDGDYGECFSDECRMEVRESQHQQQQADSLLHEAFHAVDHEMHCSLSEAQVRRMATGVLALLRDNPALVAFLTA